MPLLLINTRNNLLKIRSYDTHGIMDGLVSYSRILHSLQILEQMGCINLFFLSKYLEFSSYITSNPVCSWLMLHI